MAREKKVDPCGCKGRDLGSLGVGKRMSAKSNLPQPTGRCELLDGQYCQAFPHAMKLLFALNKKAKVPEEFFKLKKAFSKSKRDELPVVPCEQAFLHGNSEGTRAWRKLMPETKFRGCHELERDILDADLLSSRPTESFGKRHDVSQQQELVERWSENTGKDGLDFDDVFSSRVDGKRSAFTIESLTKLLDETEADIREGPGRPEGLDPFLDAHLIERMKIRLVNEERQRRHSPRFVAAVKSLTVRQRRAARLVYLENHEGLTRSEIAARLGISLDSLKERLAAVKTKMLAHYPEYVLVGAMLKKQAATEKLRAVAAKQARATERRAQSLLPCRYSNPAMGVDVSYLCRVDDPHPFGGEIRPRTDIDAAKIRELIQKEAHEKLTTLYRSTEMIAPPRAKDDLKEDKLDAKILKQLWRRPKI